MTRPSDDPGRSGAVAHQHRRARRPDAPGPLERDDDNRILAGVLGGLAAFLEVRPLWLRLLFVLSIPLTGGISLIVYLVLWLLLPLADKST